MTIFQAWICITSPTASQAQIDRERILNSAVWHFADSNSFYPVTTSCDELLPRFSTLTTHLWFLNEHCVIFYYLHMLNISNDHLTFMFPNNSWWHRCHCTCYLWERPRYWPVHEAVFEQQKSMVWWFTSDYWFSDLRILEPILENWPKSFKCVCNEW